MIFMRAGQTAKSNFEDLLYQKKKLVMRHLLGVEMRTLGRELTELASDDRYARELSAAELTEALIEDYCMPAHLSDICSDTRRAGCHASDIGRRNSNRAQPPVPRCRRNASTFCPMCCCRGAAAYTR